MVPERATIPMVGGVELGVEGQGNTIRIYNIGGIGMQKGELQQFF